MPKEVRLDKWLWAARFFKTRALAQKAIKGGKVDINNHRAKPSRLVRSGDQLRITRGQIVFEVVVDQTGEKRVSAPLAREMYRETESGRKTREAQLEKLRQERAAGQAPARKPDKRERRRIRRFVRGD